ncbi:S9 family peptidase [Pedobacter heparinus]|uniref:Peptidase S9B dipeptidylpeptidase IV domain protein n=1 Tax=Pedobacter heparinus (strain ATCC 13125 / DSM 2366 / CIP 104194 / JCM 7457 / NBRC 12017 / NCIMB 9290 / NRRL B-14731 / HIM 762-3) TaxID=485917 RepID=C6XSB2_PEDHD|nr:DPP IV N-terminal domain-containing protein [Pedobacter heparinus]ACU03457.1 peptidase S9B dipeptidylpeptidase IV domain protein [Pedobacter heparinus DSM 2366]
MKRLILLIYLLAVASGSFAQQQQQLSMQDAMSNARTTLAPENLSQLQFIYGTEDYVYAKRIGNSPVWLSGNAKSKEDQPFLTLTQLNQKLRNAKKDTLKMMPVIQFNQGPEWILNLNGSKVAINPVKNTVDVLVDQSLMAKTNAEESKAGYVAYLDNFNLFVAKDGDRKQVTTDGNSDIVYASSVHREEFGISKGTFWSNNGKVLAFYRMDQRMVTDYPIIDWTSRPAHNVNIKYPMAGDKSHHVTVGVYHAETKAVVYLKTGEPAEQYLTNIAWSPDDKYVYIAVLNRGQNHMKLNQYDAATGDFVKTLFEEKDDKYVEPLVPMLFLKNDPSKFIWQSNRDGWNHLYLYDLKGRVVKQLTRGAWEVLEVKGFDAKGERLFYVSTEESPVTRNLYVLNVKSGQSRRLTSAFAVHNTQVSISGNTVIDVYSTPDVPRVIQLVETPGSKAKLLLKSANPLSAYATENSSIFTIKSKSGEDLYMNLYKPVNYDAGKKYPVVVYWYGGPHAQLITNSWNAGAGDYWSRYMAQRGYVVLTVDVRGSDNRGRAFEQSMFRRAGEVQMEDMMSAVDYLKAQPYVDAANMGLFGWSFGGFATTDFMLTHPGVFKAAVAGGPVINWAFYEIMYTERYMDTPQENPEGYAATYLSNRVDQLKGKLLLIHGLQDPVVVQQHSVDFVKHAVDKGVQVDYMIYPGHEHNVLGKDRVQLYQKVTDYFELYLKGGK